MVGVLLIPTSAFAKDGPMMGAGEWDAKYDNPWFWLYKDYQKSFDNCVNTTSGGGDFAVQVSNNSLPGNTWIVWIWELDGTGVDELYETRSRFANDFLSFPIKPDGDNGKAELQVCVGVAEYQSEYVRLQLWD